MKIFDFLSRRINTADIEAICSAPYDALAIRKLALQTAISYVSGAISKCEFKVYDENGKEDKNSLLYYQLNVSPNKNQSSAQFISQLIDTYYRRGEVLVIRAKDQFFIAEGFSREVNLFKADVFSNICIDGQSIAQKFTADNVFYFRLENQEVERLVYSVSKQYEEAIAAGVDAFRQSFGKKYKLKISSVKVGDAEFQSEYKNIIAQQLSDFINASSAVYPEFEGYDLSELENKTANVTAGDIAALRKEVFEISAAAFKIPASMLYGNINNARDIVNIFLTFCVDPLADMISEEITRKITDYDKWKRGMRVHVDTSLINHIDILAVADSAAKLIGSGVSIDELRPYLGLEPTGEAWAQKHYITLNNAPLDSAAAAVDSAKE